MLRRRGRGWGWRRVKVARSSNQGVALHVQEPSRIASVRPSSSPSHRRQCYHRHGGLHVPALSGASPGDPHFRPPRRWRLCAWLRSPFPPNRRRVGYPSGNSQAGSMAAGQGRVQPCAESCSTLNTWAMRRAPAPLEANLGKVIRARTLFAHHVIRKHPWIHLRMHQSIACRCPSHIHRSTNEKEYQSVCV